MKKEYILRVQLKAGGIKTVREWGWSAGDAYQYLKKYDSNVGYLIEAKLA